MPSCVRADHIICIITAFQCRAATECRFQHCQICSWVLCQSTHGSVPPLPGEGLLCIEQLFCSCRICCIRCVKMSIPLVLSVLPCLLKLQLDQFFKQFWSECLVVVLVAVTPVQQV
jgi:hypothetical protein